MSDPVAVALLSTIGVILVATITTFGANIIPKLKRIESNAREANEQVSNDHIYRDEDGNPILDRNGDTIPFNIRVNMDHNQQVVVDLQHQIRDAINMVARNVTTQGEILATQGQQIQSVFRALSLHTTQLEALEDTHTKEQIREIIKNG